MPVSFSEENKSKQNRTEKNPKPKMYPSIFLCSIIIDFYMLHQASQFLYASCLCEFPFLHKGTQKILLNFYALQQDIEQSSGASVVHRLSPQMVLFLIFADKQNIFSLALQNELCSMPSHKNIKVDISLLQETYKISFLRLILFTGNKFS